MCASDRQQTQFYDDQDRKPNWKFRTKCATKDDHTKGNDNETKSYDYNLRARPLAGGGLCNSLTKQRSGFGVGVLRAKGTFPCDEGVLGVHGASRFLLHVHVLEPRGDQGRLEGLL